MEYETIKQFLEDIGCERHINLFIENEIGLELLKSLSEKNLKEILKEIGLTVGIRMKIQQTLDDMKTKGNLENDHFVVNF